MKASAAKPASPNSIALLFPLEMAACATFDSRFFRFFAFGFSGFGSDLGQSLTLPTIGFSFGLTSSTHCLLNYLDYMLGDGVAQ